MTVLSICIPTYNRSACLRELLASIEAQDRPDIEVIVSDDASPDDSADVAEQFVGRIRNLTVLRQPTNLGLDKNFLAVTSQAKGDYIWLMGDDDRLEPEGMDLVLAALKRWPGVAGLTLGVIDYDRDMLKPIGIRPTPATHTIVGAEQVFSEIPELLGFMSALVIDRRAWMEMSQSPDLGKYHNYYVQVYIIGRVVGPDGLWGVVNEPCVGFRTGNDQFHKKFGWFKRLEIDVAAYDAIAVGLFGKNSPTYRAMTRRIFDTHVMARVRNVKTAEGPTASIPEAVRYLYGYYSWLPPFWTNLLPTLLMPKWAVAVMRRAYKRLSPSSGAARARSFERASAPS